MSKAVDNYLAVMDALYRLTHDTTKKGKTGQSLVRELKSVDQQTSKLTDKLADKLSAMPNDEALKILDQLKLKTDVLKSKTSSIFETPSLTQQELLNKISDIDSSPLLKKEVLHWDPTKLEKDRALTERARVLENQIEDRNRATQQANYQDGIKSEAITREIRESYQNLAKQRSTVIREYEQKDAEYKAKIAEISPLLIKTWARLRNARIIEIPTEELNSVNRVLEKYARRDDPEQSWKHIPYPEKLPFTDVYFSFGEGANVSIKRESGDSDSLLFLGVLVTHNFASIVFKMERPNQIIACTWYEDGVWLVDDAPWMVVALVDLVNNYRTFVIEEDPTKSMRFKYRQAAQKGIVKRPIPQPYYTIRLKSKVISNSVNRTARRLAQYTIEFSYRFDVRGHERVKVCRGKLPIDSKIEKKLRKRGYKIFTTTNLDDTETRLLAAREIELKHQNEWLAMKRFWVTEHIKGPEGKPYIPAVRLVTPEV